LLFRCPLNSNWLGGGFALSASSQSLRIPVCVKEHHQLGGAVFLALEAERTGVEYIAAKSAFDNNNVSENYSALSDAKGEYVSA
jgi:hypothetical protein